ncbi:MAG TPA: sigma-70 family RNA polymerase sigma factor [Candidatus Saccharimonadales bacterium]|nr:sigma-70 family RNA polymerase sigma factor [Candidatus Saccharimonadales bacterium]
MEDLELLREYAERRSEQAFTELVQRHLDFVYSTALRLVQERPLAEDVTQMVFIKLARKAASLRQETVLTGWLYRTTQFVAQTAWRSDWRRRKREDLAMQFTEANDGSESVWKDVAPLLEKAVAQLRQPDQDAVLLRFFAGKSLREVGQALGISDDAAQKRVNRALERMRDYFASHGVATSVSAIVPAIVAHAVQAAPAGLASPLAAAALTGAAGKAGVAATLNFFKAVALAKLQSAGAGALVAAALLFTGAVVVVQLLPGANQTEAVAAADGPSPAAFTVRGMVRTPDGQPLTGALVRVATPQAYVRLYQTTIPPPSTNAVRTRTNLVGAVTNQLARAARQAPSTNSAADGGFVISVPEWPQDGLAAVVVNSDAGYALVTAEELAANPVVTVQPWARIEGVLRVGQSVASNQTVNLGIWGATELYDWNLVQHHASTRTDANGRFVFPRVAPVDIWVTHLVQVRSNDWRQSGHQYLKVLPGDRLAVRLGGTGRAVSGRVSWDGPTKLVFYGSMWASQAPGMKHPRGWKNLSREEQRSLERAWRDSPEGEAFKDSVRTYEFPLQPNGVFRVDDVRPGSYRMQVRADEPAPGGKGTRHAASIEVQVDVPEMAAGQSDEPIDLGLLVPEPAVNR